MNIVTEYSYAVEGVTYMNIVTEYSYAVEGVTYMNIITKHSYAVATMTIHLLDGHMRGGLKRQDFLQLIQGN